jgi:hypothetical protein
MARSFAPRSTTAFETTHRLNGIIFVLFRPWCIKPLDLGIMGIEQLPSWPAGAARSRADVVEKHDSIRVIHKRNVIPQVIAGIILGTVIIVY